MVGVSGSQKAGFQEGIYTPLMTKMTYLKLVRKAGESLKAGTGAILDATFGQQSHRKRVILLAKRSKVPVVTIYCRAPDETTRKRLERRAAEGRDLSDGGWEIYTEQKRTFQPFEEIEGGCFLEIETDEPTEILARTCERFIRSTFSRRLS